MKDSPLVFLPYDSVLNDVLDQVADALQRRGNRIVRGHVGKPASIADASSQNIPELEQADVAMFTMRTRCTAEMLRAAPQLRGVVYPTIGIESLDIRAADELGIIVGHGAMPENFLGVAEATVMLMLMLMYNPNASSDVLHGRRPRPKPNERDVWARMMQGQTVGMVGFGRIGRAIAERLSGWNMRILANDPYISPEVFPAGVVAADFDTVLRESDIVVVLVALTPETLGIIDAKALSKMKPDAFLINVSRGGAVDEDALADALSAGTIAGAALDVSRIEPLPADSRLRELDNVFLTPHMIGQTKDVFRAIVPTAVQNLSRILAGDLPLYCPNRYTESRWRARLKEISANHIATKETEA